MSASPRNEFADHCAELLSCLGTPRVKRMFGGHGLYVDDVFVAIVAFDRLYLKADDASRARFETAGCEPFVYEARGRSVTLGYYTVPDEAMESPALMRPWARLALEAALRARAVQKRPAVKRRAATSGSASAKRASGR